MLHDFRYALRQLCKAPGFTAIAVLSLALGMAATASLFTVVASLLRDPLPYPQADRLVQVWTKDRDQLFSYSPLSSGAFADLTDHATSFSALGVFSVERFNLGGDHAEALEGAQCTPGVFEALQVQPLLGRWFTHDDETGPTTAAVILSYALWQQRFAADPDCLGRSLRIDGRDYRIVGVMPQEFSLLTSWTRHRPLALWTLLALPPEGRDHRNWWLGAIARLKPGVSLAQATDDVHRVAEAAKLAASDADPRRTFWLMPLGREIGGIPALRISVLLAAGWSLLCLAAHNVAGMMLARGVRRQTEVSVRFALGATRWRIIRQFLAESLLISVLAAGAGLLLSGWCIDALATHLPPDILPRSGLSLRGSTLICLSALIVVATQMMGLTPALLASKTDVTSGLKESNGGSTGRRTRSRLRRLVVAQVAISLILVCVALQLSATYRTMLASSRPQRTEEVLSAALSARGPGYNRVARSSLCARLVENVAALPGVAKAGITTQLPFDGGHATTILLDSEVYDRTRRQRWIQSTQVSADAFAALGLPLQRGRAFTPEDERTDGHVVIINQAAAQKFWPGQDPLGRRVRPDAPDATPADEVIGVVADLAQTPEQPPQPEFYHPLGLAPRQDFFLIVRLAPGATAPLKAIREALHRLDPDLALSGLRSMSEHFDRQSRVFSTITTLVDALTALILGLSALGLYGTLSFHFASRQREIGVRLALGASSRRIAGLVLLQAFRWVAAGVLVGSGVTWMLSRLTTHLLENASSVGPGHLVLGLVLVALIALFGAWLPIRRAMRTDPVEALRAE